MTNPAGRKNNRYAVKKKGPHSAPSVTTVLGIINKPALSFAAAKETALLAVNSRSWRTMNPNHAVDHLKRHHRAVWDAKASRGTLVHDYANSWSQGLEVEVEDDCLPYMDALEQFYTDWRPAWVEVERTVIYAREPNAYGGSFDGIADLADNKRWLLDIKTGTSVWEEVSLQLAAYRYADRMGIYNERGDLIDTEPVVQVDRCGVIHLKADGTYDLVPVRSERAEWDYFMACRRVWDFVNIKDTRIGPPMARREIYG